MNTEIPLAQALRAGIVQMLRDEGYSDYEIEWMDQNPVMQALERGFIAGWKAARGEV